MHHPLSSWRERVRVRGINLHAILDTQYDIPMANLIFVKRNRVHA